MGIGVKHFIFEETGEIVAIAEARIKRLRESGEGIPKYAGKRVKMASVMFETRDRRRVSVIKYDFWVLHFDPDGFVDQEKLDENIRLILNIRDGAGVKREGPVLNINHRLYERRFKAEYRWMPTGEEWRGLEIRINSLISPE